ncbi:MAG TPA: ATP synthase F1 subunit gamma [Planctomycetota bacterium]|nr:ATP synthase F1 subunit gamma [Planctomycetota bacterium]
MANLKQIRKRIGSVKSTQKITRAMKLVAAARLRRAQENITRLRPYAIKTMDVLSSVAARVSSEEAPHPLLEKREIENVLLVVLTSDRGLAGAFNANIEKMAYRRWKELEGEGKRVRFAVIGRKGRDFLQRRGADIVHEFTGVFENPTLERAGEIARTIADSYVDPSVDLDACYLIYNEFKSAISQQVVVESLLPIVPRELGPDDQGEFIYEPDEKRLLDTLLPLYLEVEIYRAVLESVASEHGARMTAMDAATSNASDMIDRLTLEYNRARQAAITTELMEIIGGAEALKG